MEPIWTKYYPAGVGADLDENIFSNLVELLDYGVEKYADNRAYMFMDKSITFKELDKYSAAFGNYLDSLGLKKGDKIIMQMPNILQFPIALLGAIRKGLIVVCTNPLYTPREMLHQYNDSEAKAVVILSNFACNLEKIIADTKIEHVIITDLGDMLGGVKKHVVNFVVRNIKKMVPSYSLPKAIKFNQALELGKKMTYQKEEIAPNDIAFIQYTGGTTGVSKGAMLSHKNIIVNAEGIALWFSPAMHINCERIVLGALPLYHIFALTVNIFAGLKLSFNNLLIVNPRDMKAMFKDLVKHKIFILPGLNTLFNGMMNQAEFSKVDFSNLNITIAGGMALQSSVANRWESLTGCKITEGYGLSETSPVLSCNIITSPVIGTIGVPFPSTDMRILKEDGTWAGPNEVGEICGYGPQVMKGYYNRSEETNNVFFESEGKRFFKTGDVGLMMEDGYFKIVDRIKDMILVSGFNVYPNEVEEVIAQCPGVLEVACIGVDDEKTTEAVKVFIVKQSPDLDETKVRKYCEENLTNYKRPRYIEFKTELPKTNVGKILRRALR